jgi:uncharacterized protein (DUF1778 family)
MSPNTKTEMISIRVTPVIHKALRQAARLDRRSMSNLFEMVIRQHCSKVGIEIPENDVQEETIGSSKSGRKNG